MWFITVFEELFLHTIIFETLVSLSAIVFETLVRNIIYWSLFDFIVWCSIWLQLSWNYIVIPSMCLKCETYLNIMPFLSLTFPSVISFLLDGSFVFDVLYC